MNEQIKAIRNEIKRRMEKHWDLLPDADSPEDDWTHNELCELGACKELEHLETFIDSLPESNRPMISDSLEEAARLYAIPHYTKDIDVHHIEEYPYDTGLEAAFIAGAKWQKEQDQETIELAEEHAMLAGRMQMKEEMMKDAMDAIVENWNPDPEPEITIPLNPEEFTRGDKVRVIVLKKEDEL